MLSVAQANTMPPPPSAKRRAMPPMPPRQPPITQNRLKRPSNRTVPSQAASEAKTSRVNKTAAAAAGKRQLNSGSLNQRSADR